MNREQDIPIVLPSPAEHKPFELLPGGYTAGELMPEDSNASGPKLRALDGGLTGKPFTPTEAQVSLDERQKALLDTARQIGDMAIATTTEIVIFEPPVLRILTVADIPILSRTRIIGNMLANKFFKLIGFENPIG